MKVSRFVCALALMIFAIMAKPVVASIVYRGITNDADSGISSAKNNLFGVKLGPSLTTPPHQAWVATTINGVTFEAGSTSGTVNGFSYSTSANSAGWNNAVTTTTTTGTTNVYSRWFTYTANNIISTTVGNLTPGKEYEFSELVSSAGTGNIPVTLQLTNGSSTESVVYDPFLIPGWNVVTATFTAQSNSVTLASIPIGFAATSNLRLHGLLLTQTPEPSALAFGTLFVIVLIFRRRQKIKNIAPAAVRV